MGGVYGLVLKWASMIFFAYHHYAAPEPYEFHWWHLPLLLLGVLGAAAFQALRSKW